MQVLRTQLNHLASWAKWLSVRLRTKWFWIRVQQQSLTEIGIDEAIRHNEFITKVENKIPSITGLNTNTAVENKISDVSSLIKKTDYVTKISEIKKKLTGHNHDKYITTPEFNKCTAQIFDARLGRTDLITKTDFDTKQKTLNKMINSNKTKHVLVENESKKKKTPANIKHLIQFILEARLISKKMAHKIIQYFCQCTYILKWFLVLLVVTIFIFVNIKDFLM